MSDQIITEIPLIRRYSRSNEAQDWRFRDFVKFRLNVSNADLDAVVHATTKEVWSKIDCVACANCCKTLQVAVDADDIRRLSKRLGLSEREFVGKYVRRDADGYQHLVSGPCSFLEPDGKCGVYEDRPKACHDYPYLYDANFRSRSMTMIENASSCPIVFNVLQALKRRYMSPKR
jgi:Fe-S-cluster containining protein